MTPSMGKGISVSGDNIFRTLILVYWFESKNRILCFPRDADGTVQCTGKYHGFKARDLHWNHGLFGLLVIKMVMGLPGGTTKRVAWECTSWQQNGSGHWCVCIFHGNHAIPRLLAAVNWFTNKLSACWTFKTGKLTKICIEELLLHAHFRNNVWAYGFHLHISSCLDEPKYRNGDGFTGRNHLSDLLETCIGETGLFLSS